MSNIDYTKITDTADWEKKANNLNRRGHAFAADFNNFVKASMIYFNNEGGHNVEILNGLVAIAYNSKGMNAGHLMDYIGQTIPHKVIKDKEHSRRFLFGKKKKDESYDAAATEVFLAEHPSWADWDNGASTTPKEWDEGKAFQQLWSKAEKEGKIAEVVELFKAKMAA